MTQQLMLSAPADQTSQKAFPPVDFDHMQTVLTANSQDGNANRQDSLRNGLGEANLDTAVGDPVAEAFSPQNSDVPETVGERSRPSMRELGAKAIGAIEGRPVRQAPNPRGNQLIQG